MSRVLIGKASADVLVYPWTSIPSSIVHKLLRTLLCCQLPWQTSASSSELRRSPLTAAIGSGEAADTDLTASTYVASQSATMKSD